MKQLNNRHCRDSCVRPHPLRLQRACDPVADEPVNPASGLHRSSRGRYRRRHGLPRWKRECTRRKHRCRKPRQLRPRKRHCCSNRSRLRPDRSGTNPVALRLWSRRRAEGRALPLADMLTYAIQDEYLARAEYDRIISDYGSIRPFTNIIRAEETHVDALLPLFTTYGITIPANEGADHAVSIPSPSADLSGRRQRRGKQHLP